MANVLIVYATDWGSTKKMAEVVAAGVATVEGSQTTVKTAEKATLEDVSAADALILGSPVHMGSMDWRVKRFIDQVCSQLWMGDSVVGKAGAVFATGGGYGNAGGGCELAMCCDLRIASENARFGQPEINVGVIPGAGGTQRLSRLIGMTRAKELLYTGDMIDADTALNMGLVNKIVPLDSLMTEANALAKKLLTKSGRILALAKTAVTSGASMSLADALDYEAQCFSLCFATDDQKEGMKAFMEKRAAEFKNR